MFERRPSTNSQHKMDSPVMTPTKTRPVSLDSEFSPTVSRYGRSHKPKMQDDYVSTDKKVSAYLKLSPGNQMQYFNMTKELPKKKQSPKKISPESGLKRGRPPKPKTPPKDVQEGSIMNSIKVEPQDPSLPVNGCEWMVGDLAWGRVGGHPFWPCVIALDPLQKIFTKIVQRGRNATVGQRWIHVQFFGDNGRRSWLNSSAIMMFNGRDAFMQLAETVLAGMRKKDPKQTSAFVIKPAVVQVWEKAVQEAEDMISASREDRIGFFATHFPLVIPKPLTREELIDKVLEDTPISPPKKRGRKRKAETTPQQDEVKNKQIKLENPEVKQEGAEETQAMEGSKVEKEVRVSEGPREESHSLLSSTPRTIADRKKRQALLIQMARSNQMAAADAAAGDPAPSAPATPVDRPTPNKRPSFAESTPVEKKKPKKKQPRKTVDADFQNFCSRNFEKMSDDHPELNEKDINKHLQNLWNNMDDTAKSRYRARKGCVSQEQEDSESPEETSEEIEEENDSSKSSNEGELQPSVSSPAPSVGAAQKPSAVKRSLKNLFSGVKSEKVCQICERAGETVRCRGPCQGFYHPSCVNNPLPPIPATTLSTPNSARKGKRGKSKKSLSDSSSVENGVAVVEEKESLPPTESSISDKETEKEVKPEVKVEVVEGEAVEGKGTVKARKGSKDSLSGEEDEGFRCKDCSQGRSQPCFVCHQYIQKKTGEAKLYRCITSNCGKVYHEECLKAWPQTSWRGNNRDVLTCPLHTCHTCVSDNPGVIKARYSNDKLVRCVRCPTSYHYGNFCLPAGSEILTSSQIICPQHYKPPKKGVINHVNAAWCFICASGGSLICCELCPTAFHADCLNISTPPETYVCEDCQTGRFPLYGEIVWVKLGSYRWWPAEILYPSQIPDNILNLPHTRGEFAVKFFGSHDHYWVNRGRVFLYQDGDTAGKSYYKKSSVDQVFQKAVKEASEAQRKYLGEKASREAETRPGMKPPNYVKLKANKPVGNVRALDMNLSNLTPCECDPNSDHPCAPDSDCLNRILMVECHPQVCPAGEKCCNQLFEKRQYPPLQPYQTPERGWGLKTLVPLKKGDFVIEYVGEMIDEEEYKRRLADMHERNEDNFYFLTIDKDRMLDAGPKGNVARFMNHSCQPNCETQKWTVNGDTRVGLFALCDIPADTELVFNYNLESTGNDKKPCMCGAPNCSGFIGVKAIKQDREEGKEKKPVKKRKVMKAREAKCFMCWKEGDLLRCDGKHCTKAYHLSCLGKKQAPQGYWLCPWHQCNVCNKGRVRRCTLCVNSYCQEHADGNIREDPDSKHLICTDHDQDKTVDKVDLKDVKESSVMEVDGNSSDNSTTASSLNSEPPVKEVINNNMIKSVDSPRLRNRRSKSFADDTVVNGSVEKVNPRRKRPSSVDEALIVSHEKLEPKNKKNYKMKEKASTTNSIAREIINEVIDNLPDKRKDNLDTVEEIKENILDSSSLNEAINKSDGKSLDQKEDDLDQTFDTSTNVKENACCKESEEIKMSEDESETYNSMKVNENDLNQHDNKAQDTQVLSATPDSEPNTNLENDLANESEENNKSEQPDKSCTITESEPQVDSLNKDSSNLTNGFDNDESHSSISENSVKENCVQNCLVTNSKCEDAASLIKCLEESSNDESSKDEKQEETLGTAKIIDADDNVDDFELSYSENSSDKLFKSVNHSESSIEMKLTNCGTKEDSISRKLEEIHGTNELVNGIEQSSVMEVV